MSKSTIGGTNIIDLTQDLEHITPEEEPLRHEDDFDLPEEYPFSEEQVYIAIENVRFRIFDRLTNKKHIAFL